jgi:thiamine biosynthesis lipoprotein
LTQHAAWRAIGVGVRLVVDDGDLAAARAAVEEVLDRVDRTYSRFRDDSELMALNGAAGATVAVSPLLARAIGGALEAARWSRGAVDPTVGRALRIIGYDRDFERMGQVLDLTLRLEEAPGWTAVRLDAGARTVHLPAGVELDLGSTGKGLAADLAADAALAASGHRGGVLVSLGGDIATAGLAPDGGWRIRIAEDSAEDPADEEGEVVAIPSGAVATSSTTVRRWRSTEGVTLHHIVDPWTGGPAEAPWRTATVAAASCEQANAATTAAIVLGARAEAWLAETGLPARLVARDGTVARLNGWPDAPDDGAAGPGDAT